MDVKTKKFYEKCKEVGIVAVSGQTYVNNKTEMQFYCIECNEVFKRRVDKTLNQKQHHCWECGVKVRVRKTTLNFEKECIENNIKFVSGQTYINNKTKMKFYCDDCGEVVEKTFQDMKNGHKTCQKCKGRKMNGKNNYMYGKRGELHPSWNHELTEEERSFRHSVEFLNAMKQSKESDNYTCQVTGKRGGKIASHHVLPVCKYKEFACDPKNIVTLSEEIHKQYHIFTGGTVHAGENCNLKTFLDFLKTFKNTEHEKRCEKLSQKLIENLGGF